MTAKETFQGIGLMILFVALLVGLAAMFGKMFVMVTVFGILPLWLMFKDDLS